MTCSISALALHVFHIPLALYINKKPLCRLVCRHSPEAATVAQDYN